MATRFYLHNALSSVSGTLPSSEQSAKAINFNFDAQTVNRSMDTTIGTSMTSRTFVNTTTRSDDFGYVTKFVSEPIDGTSITAQTWTYNHAAQASNTTPANFPVSSADDRNPLCVYVWRPSTGAKVANIFDGNSSNQGYDIGFFDVTNIRNQHTTFSGSAVTCQVGDVIILEIWCILNTSSTTSTTLSIHYDGTTVNTSASGTTVTNHASFLETPQNLTFQAGGSPITMTEVAAKTYSNKFITKV